MSFGEITDGAKERILKQFMDKSEIESAVFMRNQLFKKGSPEAALLEKYFNSENKDNSGDIKKLLGEVAPNLKRVLNHLDVENRHQIKALPANQVLGILQTHPDIKNGISKKFIKQLETLVEPEKLDTTGLSEKEIKNIKDTGNHALRSLLEKLPPKVRNVLDSLDIKANPDNYGVSATEIRSLTNFTNFLQIEKAVKNFNVTRTSDNTYTIYNSLAILSPSTGATYIQLEALGHGVRDEFTQYKKGLGKKHILNREHTAAFGTGGDSTHTINITTLSSLVAALYSMSRGREKIDLYAKNSTRGVTGEHGGADVKSGIMEAINPPGNWVITTLGEAGFPYSNALVEARKMISGNHLVDPYKHVYPVINPSIAKNVITGYKLDFEPSVVALAKRFTMVDASTQITYASLEEGKSDELLPGKNRVQRIVKGLIENRNIQHGTKGAERFTEVEKYLQEKNEGPDKGLKEQVTTMLKIIGVKGEESVPDQVSWVIALNAAIMLPEVVNAANYQKAMLNHAEKIDGMLKSMQKSGGIIQMHDKTRYNLRS